MKRRRAFTLIELLVVIAIIALLVSILMPSLQKAKELAKDVVCRSNQKNVSYGILLYAEEHGGAIPYTVRLQYRYTDFDWPLRVGKVPENQLPDDFPSSVPKPWAEPNHIIYQICRNGYVDYPSFGDNDEVPYEGPFTCPSFVDQVNPKSTWENGTSYHFSLNENCGGWFDVRSRTEITAVQVSDIRVGAVLIGDGNVNPGGNIRVIPRFRTSASGQLLVRYPEFPDDFGPWTHQRHVGKWSLTLPCDFYGHPGERANLSYADGHVESVAEILHKEWKID